MKGLFTFYTNSVSDKHKLYSAEQPTDAFYTERVMPVAERHNFSTLVLAVAPGPVDLMIKLFSVTTLLVDCCVRTMDVFFAEEGCGEGVVGLHHEMKPGGSPGRMWLQADDCVCGLE